MTNRFFTLILSIPLMFCGGFSSAEDLDETLVKPEVQRTVDFGELVLRRNKYFLVNSTTPLERGAFQLKLKKSANHN